MDFIFFWVCRGFWQRFNNKKVHKLHKDKGKGIYKILESPHHWYRNFAQAYFRVDNIDHKKKTTLMEGSMDQYQWNWAHAWRVYPQYNFRQRIHWKIYIHWYRVRFRCWINDKPGEYFRPWWYYTDFYNRYTWTEHWTKFYRYFRRPYHSERVILHANYWSYWRNWWRIRRKMNGMFWSWFYNRYRDGF